MTTHVSNPDRLSRLSPEKRALLERRKKTAVGDNARNFIVRRQRRDYAAVSFAQQRLWFLHRLDPASALYNRPVTFRISGGLDTDALAQSLADVIERHDSLRTTFPEFDGEPVQTISPAPTSFSLRIIDLHDFSSPDVERRALDVIAEQARVPFDIN